jgi:hypothetical protein
MAYKITVNKACVTRADAITEIHNQLVAMGWTYVDGIVDNPALAIPYTDVSVANDTFTKVGHTLVNGTPVTIITTGTIPGGLTIDTLYYVVSVSGDTFKLATTYGGTAINLSSQGAGYHSVVEMFRIYSSNGENSDQITQYVCITGNSQTATIRIKAFYKYDLATRSYSAIAGYDYGINTSESGFYIWIHGNKNFVHILTKVTSTYYRTMFGFLKPFFPLYTTLTQAASSSANPVVLTVDSVTGFEVGYYYQIVGVSAEGRDRLLVTAIGEGTITVSSLARNYGIGARFGIVPCRFVHSANNAALASTCPIEILGLDSANSSDTLAINYALAITSIDPDYRMQKYILQPIILDTHSGSAIQGSLGGYVDEYILASPKTGMVIEDTFAVGKLDTGTSTGLNSTTVLNDTSKSWTVNAYVGKIVIIKFGLGSGMIKKIISNTATALTLDDTLNIFDTVPDTTSQYIICDEGYRYLNDGSGSGTAGVPIAAREGI